MLQRPASSAVVPTVEISDRKQLNKLKGLRVDDALLDMIFSQVSALAQRVSEQTDSIHSMETVTQMKELQLQTEMKVVELTKKLEKTTDELKKVQAQLSTSV